MASTLIIILNHIKYNCNFLITLLCISLVGCAYSTEPKTENTTQYTTTETATVTNEITETPAEAETTLEKEIQIPDNQLKPVTAEQTKQSHHPHDNQQTPSNIKSVLNEEPYHNKLSHHEWNQLLDQHVSVDGIVDYRGFLTNEDNLHKYLQKLSKFPPEDNWSKDEQLAYWINLYNAATISLILKQYPVNSIMDIENGKPWDVVFIKSGDKIYSLNQLEHDIIRPQFNEPRIHFALNCAAKSCPKLLNEAYSSDKLNYQLEQQTKYFINNSAKNQLSTNNVKLSKIFDWYRSDFETKTTLIEFINNYSKLRVNLDATVSYNEYDWKLNE